MVFLHFCFGEENMALTGKTGADAIFFAFKHICRVLIKYNAKFRAVVLQAHTAGVIDGTQSAAILALVDGSTALCAALELVAGFSGF
jgi:hypothetical protein